MNQEPGTDADIKKWAADTHNVEFPMFSKVEVNGKNTHELFKFCRYNSSLFNAKRNLVSEIPWNFAKFFLNSEGKVVSYHTPQELPESLEGKIKEMLA